ncbi:MAG: glycyl radical protein [Oscillospiraceae bacterium]|jgi:pyruvate formate-lyase/glycerol dehydratase family glycyl radical enzyme
MHISKRVEELRRRMITTPEICIERGKYVTESYMETEAFPPVIRSAKALENVLSKMSVRIEDGELLVGWHTGKTRGGALLPEINAGWVLDEMDSVHLRKWDPLQPVSEAEKAEMRAFLPYWRGRCVNDKWHNHVPPQSKNGRIMVYSAQGSAHFFAHACGDYTKLLRIGIRGIKEELTREYGKLRPNVYSDVGKWHLLEAMKISLDAVTGFAGRYASRAEELAKSSGDGERKKELLEIARICRKLPYEPADSFREALQSCWFMYVALMIEGWGAGMSLGRLDQTLYPYYKKDIEAGVITDDEVFELLCLLLIKMNGVINLQDARASQLMAGYPVMQGLVVGGVDAQNKDAVNELSYLLLEAEEAVGLTAEDLVVRISKENSDEFVIRACEVAHNLKGKLKFVSDETTIAALNYTGIPVEEAREYVSTGCHNPAIPALSHDTGGESFNTPLMVELALNNGVSRISGEQLGPRTGDPRDFGSFEELLEAFYTQTKSMLDWDIVSTHERLHLMAGVPTPLLSSIFRDCAANGRDITSNGVTYRTYSIALLGIPNVADSLAAIKKTVFDDRTLTIDRVLRLLENNLEGDDEALYLLKKAPKFGNNDPYVDDIARDVLSCCCDYIQQFTTFAGIKLTTACLAMTINIPMGFSVGALPDGRKAGMPLSEGGISPYQGRNVSGITSTLASVAHLDHVKLSHGAILNVRVSGSQFKDRTAITKLAHALRTYCETGGNLVQFNFVNNETLRGAQKNPDQYRDLLVRVATYSAYFTELSPAVQEDIINRTEFQNM